MSAIHKTAAAYLAESINALRNADSVDEFLSALEEILQSSALFSAAIAVEYERHCEGADYLSVFCKNFPKLVRLKVEHLRGSDHPFFSDGEVVH